MEHTNTPAIGEKILVTVDNWFTAPDGKMYNTVFGTLRGVLDSTETLGVKTNAKSTNWYIQVGGMLIAGCQVHYAIKTDGVHLGRVIDWGTHEGKAIESERSSRIYNADIVYRQGESA